MKGLLKGGSVLAVLAAAAALSLTGCAENESSLFIRGCLAPDPDTFSKSSDASESYIGFDLRPEDLDALYFEGLRVPRWESIKADSVDQQRALYMESYEKIIATYPLVGRISDLDQRVSYKPEEVLNLRGECNSVLSISFALPD